MVWDCIHRILNMKMPQLKASSLSLACSASKKCNKGAFYIDGVTPKNRKIHLLNNPYLFDVYGWGVLWAICGYVTDLMNGRAFFRQWHLQNVVDLESLDFTHIWHPVTCCMDEQNACAHVGWQTFVLKSFWAPITCWVPHLWARSRYRKCNNM